MNQALPVEVIGISRSGAGAKSGKPYYIHSCYATLPGHKYPQACDLFSDKVLAPGNYNVPMTFAIEDGRPTMRVELSAAQPVSAARAA